MGEPTSRCHIRLIPERTTDDALWAWLRRALRDVGYPVGGWGRGFNSDGGHMEFSLRGDGRTVAAAVRGLWENERPGYGLEVVVVYG